MADSARACRIDDADMALAAMITTNSAMITTNSAHSSGSVLTREAVADAIRVLRDSPGIQPYTEFRPPLATRLRRASAMLSSVVGRGYGVGHAVLNRTRLRVVNDTVRLAREFTDALDGLVWEQLQSNGIAYNDIDVLGDARDERDAESWYALMDVVERARDVASGTIPADPGRFATEVMVAARTLENAIRIWELRQSDPEAAPLMMAPNYFDFEGSDSDAPESGRRLSARTLWRL